MSKNLTFKGVAFGALIALSVSVVAPASAAGLADTSFVSLAPSVGTEYAVVADDGASFTLRSNEASTVVSGDLKFLVTDASGTVEPSVNSTGLGTSEYDLLDADTVERAANGIVYITTGVAAIPTTLDTGDVIYLEDDLEFPGDDVAAGWYSLTADATSTVISFQTSVTAAEAATAAASTAGDSIYFVHGARASDDTYVVDSVVSSSSTSEDLELVAASTDDVSVTVQSWVDANGNDTLDSTEYASPVRTVTFVDAATLTGVVTYDPVVLGDGDIYAYVTTTPALNGDMSSDDVEVGFTYQGVSGTDEINASFDSVTRKWEATGDNGNTLTVVNGSYSVTPYYNQTAIGPKVTIGIATAVVDEATAEASETININVYDSGTDDVSLDIRKGTLSASATYSVVDEDGVAVGAGKAVRVIANSLDLPTGAKLNGTSITDGKTFDFTTDSKGQVALTVTGTASIASDYVYLDITAEGVGSTFTEVDLDWDDAEYELYEVNNSETDYYCDSVDCDNERSIAEGGSATLDFAFVDQWAQGPLTGSYRFNVAVSDRSVSEKNYALPTTGRVSVTVADEDLGSANDYVTIAVTPQKQLANGTWSSAETEVTGENDTWYLMPSSQTNGAVTLGGTSGSTSLANEDLVTGNQVITQADVTRQHDPSHEDLYGTVTDKTDGTLRAGAKVTVSGPANVLFAEGERSAFGSLTMYADNRGDFYFSMSSNVAQTDTVITVTSQGGSDTYELTVDPADETAGSALVTAGPTSVYGGRTLSMTVTLKDKYGNVVNGGDSGSSGISMSYDGPGFVIEDPSNVSELGSDGKFTVRILLGHEDTGVATFSVDYDPSGTDFTSDDVLSASSATWVGPIANATAGAKSGRIVVETYAAKGKTVKVYVGSKLRATFVANQMNDKFVLKGVKSGARNVKVRLAGQGSDFVGAVSVK